MYTYNTSLKPLQIGELTAEKPIIQGGMGVGVSRSSLAGAVAAEGGIGIISTAQIGYDEEGFERDQAGCNRIAISKHIRRAKRDRRRQRSGWRQYHGGTETLQRACAGSGEGWRRRNYQRSRTSDGSAETGRRQCNKNCANRFFQKSCAADFENVGAPL